MKLLIRMVSGKEITLNTKHTSISEWINANFDSNKNFVWYLPNADSAYALNFNNIEMLEISQ